MASQPGPSGRSEAGTAPPWPPLPPPTHPWPVAAATVGGDWQAEPGAASHRDGISEDQEAAWRALYCVVIHSAAFHLRMCVVRAAAGEGAAECLCPRFSVPSRSFFSNLDPSPFYHLAPASRRSPLAIATATHFCNRFFAARSMARNNRFVR